MNPQSKGQDTFLLRRRSQLQRRITGETGHLHTQSVGSVPHSDALYACPQVQNFTIANSVVSSCVPTRRYEPMVAWGVTSS
jgi:hypothetical protein